MIADDWDRIMPHRGGRGRLWGLCGPAGAGKTAAGRALESQGFVRLSFAEPIRRLARKLYPAWSDPREGWFEAPVKDAVDAAHGLSPRQALRLIGEELRAIDGEIWVLAMSRAIREAVAAGHLDIVVDDVRLPAEVELLEDFGAVLFAVERPGVDYRRDHATEMGLMDLDPAPLVMVNHGSAVAWERVWVDLAAMLWPVAERDLAWHRERLAVAVRRVMHSYHVWQAAA